MNFKNSLLAACASFAIVSCASVGSVGKGPDETPAPKRVKLATVILMDGSHAAGEKLAHTVRTASGDEVTIGGLSVDGTSDSNVLNHCLGPQRAAGESAFLGAALPLIVKPLIQVLFAQIDSNLEKQLKAYTQQHSAQKSAGMLLVDHKVPSGPVVTGPAIKCIRFVRGSYVKSTDDIDGMKLDIDFDYLGQVKLIGGREMQLDGTKQIADYQAMQIAPIRVKTNQPSVKKADKVAYSLALKITGTQSDGRINKYSDPIETVLVTGKYKAVKNDRKPTTYTERVREYPYFATERDTHSGDLPILPLPGEIDANGASSGLANLQFTLTETGSGARKARIETWRTFLGKAGDDIADAVSSAVGELVNPEEDEEATPDPAPADGAGDGGGADGADGAADGS